MRNSDLQSDVRDELAFDPSVDARHIAARTAGDTVTLSGTVPSYSDKLAAERAVKRVSGVRGVTDELMIDLPAFHRRTDADIAASAREALRSNSGFDRDAIAVTVDSGWLTLAGTVDWQFQRERAREAVASLVGVHGISNEIVLTNRVAVSDVRAQIAESFRRSAQIDAKRIDVEASGGTVTLRGSVDSWIEREDAAIAAYSIAGVTHVRNLTTVL